MAVGSIEPVVGASEVRKLEDLVRDLERLLGSNTIENEILREALAKSRFRRARRSISTKSSAPAIIPQSSVSGSSESG